MERIPGVLLYKLASFCGLEEIALIDLLSSGIHNKLVSNVSAFHYSLRKNDIEIGSIEKQNEIELVRCKKLVKDREIFTTIYLIHGNTHGKNIRKF
jgi:hypothetical protein